MKLESDIRFISLLINISVYFGMAPFAPFSEKHQQHSMIKKLYIIFLQILCATGTSVNIYLKRNVTELSSTIFFECARMLIELLITVAALIGANFLFIPNWKLFSKTITNLDSELENVCNKMKKSLWIYIWWCFVFLFPQICLHTFDVYTNHVSFAHQVALFYQFYNVLIMYFVINMIKNRYDVMKLYLEDIFYDVHFLQRDNNTNIITKIREIGKILRKISTIIQQFNVLFGWQIFFLIVNTVSEITASINIIMIIFGNASTNKDMNLANNFIYLIIYSVS